MDKRWIIGAVVVSVVVGILIYFLARSKTATAIHDRAEELQFYDHSLTDLEATAEAAEQVGAEALATGQQAEAIALIQEQAEKLRMMEETLAHIQQTGILTPTAETLAQAQAAEEATRLERIELERRWTEALNTAEVAMLRAKEAAVIAVGAYSTARGRANQQLALVESQQQAIKKIEAEMAGRISHMLRLKLYKERTGMGAVLNSLEAQYAKAKDEATRCKTSAVGAVSHANDCVERALTITADLRLLGLLLTLAGRLDTIAYATRTKIKELEGRLA